MTLEIVAVATDDGVLVTARLGEHSLPFDAWYSHATDDQVTALAVVFAALEAGAAEDAEAGIRLSHDIVADLSPRDARILGLPSTAPYALSLENRGTIDSPDFRVLSAWLKENGQPVVSPRRVGALLVVGQRAHRIPNPLFRLAEAVDRFAAIPPTDADQRFQAWGVLQRDLPAEAVREIKTSGYLRQIRVAYAGAFSLHLTGTPNDLSLDPVLFPPPDQHTLDALSAGEPMAEPEPLLPAEQQKAFAGDQFRRYDAVRGRYALGGGWYVALAPGLHRALEVVRQVQRADTATRRDFARNPRSYLRDQLAEELDETYLESLFVETAAFSERVKSIGLWQPKVLPWVVLAKEPWLPPIKVGILLDGQPLEIAEKDLPGLITAVERAIAEGCPTVDYGGHAVPATPATLDALTAAAATFPDQQQPADSDPGSDADEAEPRQRLVLVIEDNLDTLFYERAMAPRLPSLPTSPPTSLRSAPKPHQSEGLEWLQTAWNSGRPGVLLADDMGLGKTFQALAFLAWLKEAMARGAVRRKPVMIVAPTGLLANWEKEHGIHLASPGLGTVVRAHGEGLAALRVRQGQETKIATPVLDEQRIAQADWVLATYETVRDYQHTFGRIPFAAVVFDEAQKIKTPGTLVTEAAKALRTEFVIAMTGTPVENRLADLWCLIDTIQPGLLGELRSFSRAFEENPDRNRLGELKSVLTRSSSKVPALMLRRMKSDQLRGLPEKHEHIVEEVMPDIQRDAYEAEVRAARQARGKSGMLTALQRMRLTSLHPLEAGALGDGDYIKASARFAATFRILDEVANRNEKALVFLEFIEAQAHVAALIQRRYGLTRPPMLINGSVAGTLRQARVDAFQKEHDRFDVIILSPRAGGVGLTLTAANHVVHLSRWWNPAVEDQCTDRVYRIGQERPVHVYYPLALLPDNRDHSFDMRLHQLLERKRILSRDLLLPPGGSDSDIDALYRDSVGLG